MTNIAFFNNKGGVGRTSLVYHLAWMYAELGTSVVAADLDPQANLSGMFLDEERIEELWPNGERPGTVYGAMQPLLDGTGDIASPHVEAVSENIGLLVGDLALAASEDELNSQWPDCLDRRPRAFRVMSAFWRMIKTAVEARDARVALLDVGPNLGAINRAALLAADFVVIPLAPDLYSIHGLRNLGPTLRRWRDEWQERHGRNPVPDLDIPPGTMTPAGYIVLQHAVRLDRPTTAYDRWMRRIPYAYGSNVMDKSDDEMGEDLTVENDAECLATLKHYRSLMAMAQEVRKPIFLLRSADGVVGSHALAVRNCYADFRALALALADRCHVSTS